MAFDPDAYLANRSQGTAFDPDEYLANRSTRTPFDPDAYLASRGQDTVLQEPEGVIETTKVLADDLSNQFNNSIATFLGAPVDLISLGINKVSNAIVDRDIVPEDAVGGSESMRKIIQGLSFGAPVRDEPARTKAGTAGQVLGEAVGFTIPALKVAQAASKTQATTRAGQVGVNIAKQFTDEATKNTGRFLAIESGAVTGQTAGRILQEEADLSPGAALAVEVLTGLTGALAGDKGFSASKNLINKTRGKTAEQVMELVAKGDISYKDLTFTPAKRPLFKEDGTFNFDESLPVSTSETDLVTLYRGGAEDVDSPVNYTTPNKKLAKEYATGKETDKILEYKIPKRQIASEDEARNTLIELGYKGRNNNLAEEGLMHELLDPKFRDDGFYLGDDASEKLVKALKAKGFKAYEAEGIDLTSNKSTQEVVLFKSSTATPLMPGIMRQNFDEAQREIALNLLAKQRTNLALDAGDLNNYAPGSKKKPRRLFNRINSWLAPSKVVGRDILNEIEQAKGVIREAESVGIRTYNAVERIKKANPDNIEAIDENVNSFLLGGELDPSLVPIETELTAWRTSTNQLRERLIGGMEDQAFMDLAPEIRKDLRKVLEESMDVTGGYLTQPYRLFEDPDYKPTPQQEKAAFEEIRDNLMESGVSEVEAIEKASKRINDLNKVSAKTLQLDSRRGAVVSESESILRQRTFPGEAERAWLGEITDPAQRALITSRRLSRLASAKAEDAEIANFLLDSGVATRTAREGQVELKLKTISGDSNIFLDPEIADSIYKLRYGPIINQGIRDPMDVFVNAFFTANFAAKFTKVIGNVGSYPVAALGAVTSTIANGVIPNFSGMRKSFASFRSLENFVSGKSPKAKKEFYAELDKMDLYNLRPKSIDAADMEATLKRGFQILDKLRIGKAVDLGGKAYSAFDVAMRYVTWKGTQRQLEKVFPNYSKEQIEAAAARITNDTFPNYDKLSEIVRKGSRVGLLQPFIAHFAELSRISYNQGKIALQMVRGNFGRNYGLDPSRADFVEMAKLGAKRGASFAMMSAGSIAYVKSKNEENGLDDNSVQAFEQSVLPFWMDGTTAIISPNKDNPRRGFFVPPEYAVPQIAMGDAFNAALKQQPFEEYASILKGRIFSEGGSLGLQTIGKLVNGYDERGRSIFIDPSLSATINVIASTIYDDVIKPGTFRTIERFQDSINGIGDRTTKQNVQSLFGWRVYTYDADVSFRGKFFETSDMMQEAKGKYTREFRKFSRGDISREDLEASYIENNTARRNRLEQAKFHYNNMRVEPLNYSLDERITIMKDGGLSNLDILDIITNHYTDMPRSIKQSTAEKYDNLIGDKEQAIRNLPDSNPDKAILRKYFIRQQRINDKNISELDKVVMGLGEISQKVDFLKRVGADKSEPVLKEYLSKDPQQRDIRKALQGISN